MALSNMRNEPWREGIETAVGLALFAACLFISLLLGSWFQTLDPTMPWLVGAFLGLLACAFGLLALALTPLIVHFVGEGVCDLLEWFDIDPRPRFRPGRFFPTAMGHKQVTRESWRGPELR